MAVANCLQMLKTVIMDFSVIKPHFSRRLSRLFFSVGSRLSRIFRGRLAGLAQIAAGGRLSRRLGGLGRGHFPTDFWKEKMSMRIMVRNQNFLAVAPSDFWKVERNVKKLNL